MRGVEEPEIEGHERNGLRELSLKRPSLVIRSPKSFFRIHFRIFMLLFDSGSV